MQLCESCGACRETEWRTCPFCRASLTSATTAEPGRDGNFDALAAATEASDDAVLPSMIVNDDSEENDSPERITAQDLAHLTGDGGPAAHPWESPPAPAPPSIDDKPKGVDTPVSKAVVLPLVAAALAAVVFVAYSIVTAPAVSAPDAVALMDTPTTTAPAPSQTEPAPEESFIGPVGIDLAEQAEWLCAGSQFSIARAEVPSLAVYNDLLLATRDGRDAWIAPPDHETLSNAVPPLVGCLTTADGGEIDRCQTGDISRRSVMWSYRVLQASNGALLGSDEGTATDVRPCDELANEGVEANAASWAPLPQERLNQVAAAHTSAPHPQVACSSSVADASTPTAPADDASVPTLLDRPAAHATFDGITDADVPLPPGWTATAERPVEVVLCLELVSQESSSTQESGTEACTIRVTAQTRNGQPLGSWDHECTAGATAIPEAWWTDVVGPDLGYELESSGGE